MLDLFALVQAVTTEDVMERTGTKANAGVSGGIVGELSFDSLSAEADISDSRSFRLFSFTKLSLFCEHETLDLAC